MNFLNLFNNKPNYTKEQIASILNTSPEALETFENIYKSISEEEKKQSKLVNSKDMAKHIEINDDYINQIVDKIVNELRIDKILPDSTRVVSILDINCIPKHLRPQLTGTMYKTDCTQDSADMLLFEYSEWLKTKDLNWYHRFRQGLDISDLDPITYEIIGMNPNSMSYWFPTLKEAVNKQTFFKVPETQIVKVPLPILQLTRLDYESLTPTTLKIVDKWCQITFNLVENKRYFIKTGTYSSKYDFRNAIVTDKEIYEIGQYFLFIHNQALSMAHYDITGQGRPIIYGVSTTNEWVVREFIEDVEDLPCIYHGLPLRTEYRVFVDFDQKEVLGTFLYWDPELMKKRFSQYADAGSADMTHDYIIYCKEEPRLVKTFKENKDKVTESIQKLIFDMNLTGQWSIDIMQNGMDFYIIDMAQAYNSALVNKLPMQLPKPEENWVPNLNKE